jgi:histidinol phosphatase-like PHP family hydrolase
MITSDWHIHSRNSCDSACMIMADLVAEAALRGVTDFGVTDHINTPFNLPDLDRSRAEYQALPPSPHFHFGVEASCVSAWELDRIAQGGVSEPVWGLRSGGPAGAPLALGLTAEDLARLGIEYVIGGTHWPMYVPYEREAVIRDYHRQNLFLACHPLVTIVAHPWWWMGHWQDADGAYRGDPWLDDFGRIPTSMHDEFAAAAREYDTVVEVNLAGMLLNPQYPERFRRQYLDYLAGLKAAGVRLSIGSDCHSSHYDADFQGASALLATAGFTARDFWRLPPGPP